MKASSTDFILSLLHDICRDFQSSIALFQSCFNSAPSGSPRDITSKFKYQDAQLHAATTMLTVGLEEDDNDAYTKLLNMMSISVPYLEERVEHLLAHRKELVTGQELEFMKLYSVTKEDVSNAISTLRSHTMQHALLNMIM